MSMPHGHREPEIPSVFVAERSGFILTKLLEVEGGELRVHITPVRTSWLGKWGAKGGWGSAEAGSGLFLSEQTSNHLPSRPPCPRNFHSLSLSLPQVSAIAWLSALLSALLGLLMVGIVMASCFVLRTWGVWVNDMQGAGAQPEALGPAPPRPPAATGLAPSVIRALPVIIFEGSRTASEWDHGVAGN
jgi:hypothetical protein